MKKETDSREDLIEDMKRELKSELKSEMKSEMKREMESKEHLIEDMKRDLKSEMKRDLDSKEGRIEIRLFDAIEERIEGLRLFDGIGQVASKEQVKNKHFLLQLEEKMHEKKERDLTSEYNDAFTSRQN